jgi:hypothetical protein
VRGDTVNCLLAARYNDSGRTRKQDRILVDMKRFTNDQSAGGLYDAKGA